MGFMVPFLLQIFVLDEPHQIKSCLVTCMVVMAIFSLYVILQIKLQGIRFFLGFWNINELALYFEFVIYTVIRYRDLRSFRVVDFYELYNDPNTLEEQKAPMWKICFLSIFSIMLIIQGLLKCLSFMRVYDNFSFVLTAMSKCFIAIIPLVFLLYCWIFVVSMLLQILGAEYPNNADDYPFMSELPMSLMNAYRNSIGDSILPKYRFWLENYDANDSQSANSSRVMITFIWIFWMINQFSVLIFALNFLIAQVQQILEQSLADQMLDRYLFRCKLIKENYALYQAFRFSHEMMIFRISADCSAASVLQQWSGFVQTLKVFIRGQNLSIKEKISEEITELEVKMGAMHEELDDKIDKVAKKLDIINDNIEDQLTKID